jgi:cytochrome c oxidase cbb3-type subunit 3
MLLFNLRLNLIVFFLLCIPQSFADESSLVEKLQDNIDAESLFNSNCRVCHGDIGNGGLGLPIESNKLKLTNAESFLKNTIKHGRPGRVMPPFKNLSEKEIDAIANYILNDGISNPDLLFDSNVSLKKADSKIGKNLYQVKCESCHGIDGEGGAGTGVSFSRPRDHSISAPSLANKAFLLSASNKDLKNFITYNSIHSEEHKDISLSEEEINSLVYFIRSLERKKSPLTTKKKGLPAYLKYYSTYDFDTTVNNIKQSTQGSNFRFIREESHNFSTANGNHIKNNISVFVCNFSFLNEVIKIDPRIGIFLPCRITIIEDTSEGVYMTSINPEYLKHVLNNTQLYPVCDKISEQYHAIMEEATL